MGLLKAAFWIALLSIGLYYLKQWSNGPMCKSTARLDGKVVIVTGANSGTGKETALDLVRRGAKVYLACRSLEKGQAAAKDITNLTSAMANRVIVEKLDLSSLASIREFVKTFKSKEKKLDILVNNAATMGNPLTSTIDGFELQVGTNHLGHFLLTTLLMEPLLAAAPSRVVTVSSGAHHIADALGFDQMKFSQHSEATYSRWRCHGRSKLYNILFSQELARRLQGTGVTTYSLHPGIVMTNLWKWTIPSYPNVAKYVSYLAWPITKDVVHGAQTTICTAVDPNLAKETGKYYADVAEKQTDCRVCTNMEEEARTLWSVSKDLVQLRPDETIPSML